MVRHLLGVLEVVCFAFPCTSKESVSFALFFSSVPCRPEGLTAEADWPDLEAELLACVAKVAHRHVDDGQRVGLGGVYFQHCPFLSGARLGQKKHHGTMVIFGVIEVHWDQMLRSLGSVEER